MNNVKITYDGRITCWNSKKIELRSFGRNRKREKSPEMALFSSLPEEGKVEFLNSGLGSSHDANSQDAPKSAPRARRGTKGITSYGRSLIRMGCQFLEDRYGVENLSFLTCTLPESALIVCTPETWAEVVRRFLISLRARLGRASLPTEIVGCTEVQGSRLLRSSGQPPLHLHLVFVGRHRWKPWSFRPDQFQSSWECACQSVWADSQGFQSSCRVERISSSSVSYMGKYMSKGGDVLSSCKQELLPSSWYTISTKLKDLVKRAEFRCSGELASALYEYFYSGDFLLWARTVWSPWSETGTRYLVAWIGAIRSRDKYWEIVNDCRDFLRSQADAVLTPVI